MKFAQLTNMSILLLISTSLIVASQSVDELKEMIVNDWKSIGLELVPNALSTTPITAQYQRRQFNFTSDLQFTMLIENFNDYKGSSKITTFSGTGTVSFQSQSSVISGAYLCQFTFDQALSVTLHDENLVQFFNSLGGDVIWKKDEPQDILKKTVNAINKKADENFIAYDHLYVKDDYLYMGVVDAFGTESSKDISPKGLCAPLVPFDSDFTPLTLDETKSGMVDATWSSLTKEVRPSIGQDGQIFTIFITRELTFPTDSTFIITINLFQDQTSDSFFEIKQTGDLVWEGEASEVVSGAQWTQFQRVEFYVTPKSDEQTAALNSVLPQGVEQFVKGQQKNLTGVDFPALGQSKDVQYKESDLIYLRENRLFIGARPVNGEPPTTIDKRTYSLSNDLIDPSRSANNSIVLFISLIALIWI